MLGLSQLRSWGWGVSELEPQWGDGFAPRAACQSLPLLLQSDRGGSVDLGQGHSRHGRLSTGQKLHPSNIEEMVK